MVLLDNRTKLVTGRVAGYRPSYISKGKEIMKKIEQAEDTRPSIFVAQPSMGLVRVEHILNITSWFLSGKYRMEYSPSVGNIPHDRARNILISRFLKTDFDYILFIDERTVGHVDTLDQLLAADKPVISATSQTFKILSGNRKALVPTSFVAKEGKNKYRYHAGKGVEEVDVTNMACTLVKREVIENMARPWFKFEFLDEDGTELMGEEFTFCQKVKEAGYKIYVDYDVLTHHFVYVDSSLVNNLVKTTHNNAVQKTFEALKNPAPDAEEKLDILKL